MSVRSTLAQSTSYLILKPEVLPLVPEEFYIKEVLDVRKDKSGIGRLSLSNGAGKSTELLDVQGGLKAALSGFMQKSFRQDRTLRPVIVQVKKCQVEEELMGNGLVQGEVGLFFSFMLEKGDSLVHLLDYKGGARYKRSSGRYSVITSALKQSLVSSLNYFNDWISQEAPHNIKLAKGVKLSIVDYGLKEKGDTVFYHNDRKLTWDDFEARPHPGSSYSASIFTSFAWEGDPFVEEGALNLELVVKVFMLKASSWVKASVRDDYGLNHEQRHFDITKIIVERFKEKVRQMELTPDSYDGKIGFLYIETYREMNKMQEAYDQETDHGKNKMAQERWNLLIDQELKKYANAPSSFEK
ncbi:hypothetical protein GCM10028791_14030 [Echinicola sediminis]